MAALQPKHRRAPDRYALVDRDHPELLIRQQCELLGSAFGRLPEAGARKDDLGLTRRIDGLFTAWPVSGLAADGAAADGRRHSVILQPAAG